MNQATKNIYKKLFLFYDTIFFKFQYHGVYFLAIAVVAIVVEVAIVVAIVVVVVIVVVVLGLYLFL